MIVAIVFVLLNFTACARERELEPMNFEYTLEDKDLDETLAVIKELETYIDNNKNFKIVSAEERLNEKLDFILHQYFVARIQYYSDLEDDEAYDRYVFGENTYFTVREESRRVLKKLYYSDLPARKRVFADWTENQIKYVTVFDEGVAALEKEQNELVSEYLSLEDPGSEEWSAALEDIYFEYVESAQQLAALYDYDNYYDYAASEIYMREYTEEQRVSFRKNVKEYILPYYIEIAKLYDTERDQLTDEQEELFVSLRNDSCASSNEYLSEYIDSYPEKMGNIMRNLFEREAVVYTQSENAYQIAYTNYSEYLDQPFVFLGNGWQDMLTVVHELGHYAAFYHFSDGDLPYDTCEVHSQGNEWLIMRFLDGKLDESIYKTFLLWRLRYGLELIITSTFIDEYEEEVYKRDKIDSPQELEIIMEELLKEYEGIEQLESKESLYTYVQDVTIAAPVYYLNYATSEMVSMLFYTIADEKGYEAAQDIYIDLCLETPTDNTFIDTLRDIGFPDPFESDTVVRAIESFESVVEDDMQAAA